MLRSSIWRIRKSKSPLTFASGRASCRKAMRRKKWHAWNCNWRSRIWPCCNRNSGKAKSISAMSNERVSTKAKSGWRFSTQIFNDSRPNWNCGMLEKDSLRILQQALERLDAGFVDLPSAQESSDSTRILEVLNETADRLQQNYPYFHPLYAGQMLKPPHPVARLAYALAQWINPNNHALDGGRASS